MTIIASEPRLDGSALLTDHDAICPAVLPGERDIIWDFPDDAAMRYVERAELRCRCCSRRSGGDR